MEGEVRGSAAHEVIWVAPVGRGRKYQLPGTLKICLVLYLARVHVHARKDCMASLFPLGRRLRVWFQKVGRLADMLWFLDRAKAPDSCSSRLQKASLSLLCSACSYTQDSRGVLVFACHCLPLLAIARHCLPSPTKTLLFLGTTSVLGIRKEVLCLQADLLFANRMFNHTKP